MTITIWYNHYTDQFKGMVIIGNTYSKFNATEDQQLSVKECGLKILLPANVVTPVDASYEIAANGFWGGKFEFPKGSKLISGVCYISSSSQFNEEVTVQLEHCANITHEKQAKYLSFVVARSCSPFKFKYLDGGSFCPGSQFGTIKIKKFSLLAIVLCAAVGGAIFGVGGAVVGSAVVGSAVVGGAVVGGAVGAIAYQFATSKFIVNTYIFMK